MTILNSAYDTTACRSYNMAKIKDPLIALHLMNGTTPHLDGKVLAVERYYAGTGKVDTFAYPVIDQRDGVNQCFVDLRALVSYDEISDKLRIRDSTAYNNKLIVGAIAKDWADGRCQQYLTSYPVGLQVFGAWLGEAISGRFPVDPATQLKISVLAAVLYINNFHTEEQTNERDHKAMVQSMINRHCQFVHPDVGAIVQEYHRLCDLESFCEAIREFTQNVRLRDLNVSTLFECVGGWWFSSDGRETMAVCLEYPPMWLGVLLSVFSDRSYQKSRLGRIAERGHIKREGGKFVQRMLNIGD